jgi:hypothetical protein
MLRVKTPVKGIAINGSGEQLSLATCLSKAMLEQKPRLLMARFP